MKEKEDLQPDNNAEQQPVEATEQTQAETIGQTDSATTADLTAEMQEKYDELQRKYLYLAADFDNFKRHAARERIEMIQTAGKDMLTSLLPILDDFDRAAKNGALTEGTTLIHNKLIHTLKMKGLSVLEIKAGDAFNPDQQEAITEIPAPSPELSGKIVDVIEPGYQLGERIVRFAKVVVGK